MKVSMLGSSMRFRKVGDKDGYMVAHAELKTINQICDVTVTSQCYASLMTR